MDTLLMIPGPIELSPLVQQALMRTAPSHVAPDVIEAFGLALERMRIAWCAPAGNPFAVPGGGTLAMEMAATNLVDPDQPVVVLNTGYFGDRMAEMLRRRGARVTEVTAPLGATPDLDDVRKAITQGCAAVFTTHVDTSTGVRVDPEPVCALAAEVGALTVFDGVCATAGERFEMEAWGADVYLTASQKAVGLPPGLALLVASDRALAARDGLSTPPPMSVDMHTWRPIMEAYLERRPSYFSTPPTSMLAALAASLGELSADGMEARFTVHARAAAGMRAAWRSLDLKLVPRSEEEAANTLSALRYPDGVDKALLGRIKENGAVVAGGLHPAIKTAYFRVGHMGYSVTRPDHLRQTVSAVARGLGRDPQAAIDALMAEL